MIKPFDQVRKTLEQQYKNADFPATSGLAKDDLQTAFQELINSKAQEPKIMIRARLFHLLCSQARIALEPNDYFVGKLEHHSLITKLQASWRHEAGQREFRNDSPPVPGSWMEQLDCNSHICPNWHNLLSYGIKGLRDRAASKNTVFHQAVTMVYDGIIILIKRFDRLHPHLQLAALAERPPETLWEALQTAYLYHELQELNGIQVRSMGRFDILYNRFYLNDLRTGRITREGAKELLKYFMIKFYAKTQGKAFGKPFLFGPDVNELSYISFDVFQELNLVDPKFHVRLGLHTPVSFLQKIASCIQSGCTSIVIVNNEEQVAMLEQNGKTAEDAENYILIGCYEPAVMGEELNCSGAATLNLAKVIELILEKHDYSTFDDVMNAYINTLDLQFTKLADNIRRWEQLWPAINPSPLLSGTITSCIEKGLDVSEAGAKYNTTGCCCVGLANAVDSLMVINQLVYEEKHCSLQELYHALQANWTGYKNLRLKAIHRVPKWGNNDKQVNNLAVRIACFLGNRINHEPNARGGVFQAALYGIMVAAKNLGDNTGALPDGRLAGTPLTLNTGASPGMDKNGVTTLINSVTQLDLSQFPNGTVLDIMLHPSTTQGPEGNDTLCNLIRSHFAQGGMAIQFNIFDTTVLREAQKNPEKYANLQVRVCGWSVRFADLAPDEQDIFITKTEAVS